MRGRNHALLWLASLALLCAAPFWGGGLDGPRGEFVLWQLRLPRALVGALVGATLSLAGAVFQSVFNNPLAAPSTVGTTAGATLGALAGFALVEPGLELGLPVATVSAFVGALLASLLVLAIAASGRAKIGDVLLAGIAVALAASALSTALEYAADMQTLFVSAQWSLGRLPQLGYEGVLLLLPFATATLLGLLALTRPLQALARGEELAHAEGVDVRWVRLFALALSSLGVAACVAWCGPIAFVGLIVPHIVRLATGVQQRTLLPLSAISGAAFLVTCDSLARTLLPGRELPVGVVTAALGAPMLLFLITRGRR
jgi:iron complex transport system permease protein